MLQLFGALRGHGAGRGPALGEPVLHASGGSRCACATSRARKLKVNDTDGNPIEIAAVVVWQVVDTAEAVFEVDDYENFVQRADRGRACATSRRSYPYDAHEDGQLSLRGHTDEVAKQLQERDPGAARARPASR